MKFGGNPFAIDKAANKREYAREMGVPSAMELASRAVLKWGYVRRTASGRVANTGAHADLNAVLYLYI